MDARLRVRGRVYFTISREARHYANSSDIPVPGVMSISADLHKVGYSEAGVNHFLATCRSAELPLRTSLSRASSAFSSNNFYIDSISRTHATATYWSSK